MDGKKIGRLALPAAIAAAATGAIGAAAWATETITYSYDARGRLVKAERTGSVNDGVDTAYSYDKADNRKTKVVTGAP